MALPTGEGPPLPPKPDVFIAIPQGDPGKESSISPPVSPTPTPMAAAAATYRATAPPTDAKVVDAVARGRFLHPHSSTAGAAAASRPHEVFRIDIGPQIRKLTREQREFKNHILEILANTKLSFVEKTEAIAKLFNSKQLPEVQAFDKFLGQHQQFVEELGKDGWVVVKKHHKEGMATEKDEGGLTREELRSALVKQIIKVTQAIIKEMGETDVGFHQDLGSAGWDSDIDTTFFAPIEMSYEMKIVYKFLFDMVAFDKLKGLSGDVIDTECYLEHAATVLETQDKLTKTNNKEMNAYLEKCMTMFHRLQDIRTNAGEGWEKEWGAYKKTELEAIARRIEALGGPSNPARKRLENYYDKLENAFKDVEAFCQQVEREVGFQVLFESDPPMKKKADRELEKDQVAWMEKEEKERNAILHALTQKNPKADRLARMTHKTNHLVAIAKQMDGQQFDVMSSREPLSNIMSPSNKAETALLDLKRGACLISAFFDEAIYSEGAISKVVYRRGGQGIARAEDKTQALILEAEIKSGEYAPPGISQKEFEAERKAVQEMVRTGVPIKKPETPVNKARKSTWETPFKLEDAKHQRANSPLDELSTQEEQLAMYAAHFAKGAKKETYPNALIKTAKYSERAMHATMGLLLAQKINAMTNKPLQLLVRYAIQDPQLRLTHLFEKEMGSDPGMQMLLEAAEEYSSLESLWGDAEKENETDLKNPLVVLDFLYKKAVAKNRGKERVIANAIRNPRLNELLTIVGKNFKYLPLLINNIRDPAFMLDLVEKTAQPEGDVKAAHEADAKAKQESDVKAHADVAKCPSIHFITKELEKCKRDKQLNRTATEFLLKERLQKIASSLPLKEIIDSILKLEDPGGAFAGSQENLTPQRKLDLYLTKLAAHGVNVDDKELLTILQARAGFPKIVNGKAVPELEAILQRGKEITLKELDLDSQEKVIAFNKLVEDISRIVRLSSIELGTVPSLPVDAITTSLLQRWQKA